MLGLWRGPKKIKHCPAAIGRHLYMAVLPDHPHERREQAFRLPALAERLQRAILHRRQLARVPQDRLPARDPRIPAAHTSIWRLRRIPQTLNWVPDPPQALTDDDARHATPVADVLEDQQAQHLPRPERSVAG